jgi:hypothetical protein
MGLRLTKWDENLGVGGSSAQHESPVHPISVGAFPVWVEAASGDFETAWLSDPERAFEPI